MVSGMEPEQTSDAIPAPEEAIALPAADAKHSPMPKLHKLGAARRRQGLSVRCVAQRLGRTVSEVRAQEDEHADLLISELYRWQAALEVPIEELAERPAGHAFAASSNSRPVAASHEDGDGDPPPGALGSGTPIGAAACRATAGNHAGAEGSFRLAGRGPSPHGRRNGPDRAKTRSPTIGCTRRAEKSRELESRVKSQMSIPYPALDS